MPDALKTPADWMSRLDGDIEESGGELIPDEDRVGAIGVTMFDLPSSEDDTVTVLLPKDHLQAVPSQALVRIKSQDGRRYLGIVTSGPFAEPDSLRGDSQMLVTVATRGGVFLPPHHGRVQVVVLGEELHDGSLTPPRLRPLPNSAVFALDAVESAAVLRTGGDLRLGLVVGYDDVVINVPSDDKAVLPRHTAVLGTTGGGKSTTISRLVQQAQRANVAVVVLDVEGEYTFLYDETDDAKMLAGLKERGLEPAGVPADQMNVLHLIGRDTANPSFPRTSAFSLQFARLSPHHVIEIPALSEAQQERFLAAYDIARAVMRELGVFPAKGKVDEERRAMEWDEFDRGYPRLTLQMMMDVVGTCLTTVQSSPQGASWSPSSPQLTADDAKKVLAQHIAAANLPKNAISWRALLGRLSRLNRVKVFDRNDDEAGPLRYKNLLKPGTVSIIDLSDSGASELNNIVIADLLHGLQEAQDESYKAYEEAKRAGSEATQPSRLLLVIEEAHEFLSAERIEKMPVLFQQVARIAKRGRKRWIGLVFVTQLPQHLPRQILGLVNSFILHKITDPQVVSALQRTVPGIDESLWRRLPALAPGQAIVSFPHMTRPLLASIDPAPAKLRLVD